MSLNHPTKPQKFIVYSYKPEVIDIDTQLKPFIPEYIPAVGEVDAMLKIPRPDNEHERLGLEILDEPKLNQSKKAVLDLKIAEYGLGVKKKDYKEVHSIENAHKNTRQITDWVKNVEEIIANRHAAVVIYTNKMPEIDDLMQVYLQRHPNSPPIVPTHPEKIENFNFSKFPSRPGTPNSRSLSRIWSSLKAILTSLWRIS